MRSVNRVFACLPTGRKRRQSLEGVPITQYLGLAAITAWHCVSSVNTDDSRQTELYYNFTKLQWDYFKTSNGYKAHDLSLAW